MSTTGDDSTLGQPTTRADTLADRREFLTDGLSPHDCDHCGTRVLVKKNSPKHTSIQFTGDATEDCPVFAAQVDRNTPSALLDTCPRLSESIQRAVRDGQIGVQQ